MATLDTPEPDLDYLSCCDDGHAETLAVQWIRWLTDVKHHAVNTRKQYIQVLQFWLQWCERNGVEPLSPDLADLERFMTRKHVLGRKGSVSTQRTDAVILRGWFTWLQQRGLVSVNPALDLRGPKAKARLPKPIEDEHWQTIWLSDLPPRLRTTLGLGYYAGLRREELGALTTDKVTETRIVRYLRKGDQEDTTPWRDMAEAVHLKLPHLLPDMGVLTHAVNHVRNNYDRVVQWQDGKELWRRMQKLCGSLNIPAYTPHQLRHSTATNLLRAGIRPHIVMRLMNHSSFDITMGYARAGANDLREWLDDL